MTVVMGAVQGFDLYTALLGSFLSLAILSMMCPGEPVVERIYYLNGSLMVLCFGVLLLMVTYSKPWQMKDGDRPLFVQGLGAIFCGAGSLFVLVRGCFTCLQGRR